MREMKTFENYIKNKMGIEFPKQDEIPGSWFYENGLPMIVECCCCTMSMISPSAMVDEEGYCYCSSCAE